MDDKEQKQKNKLVEQEEETLRFWRENKIFEKTLEKNKDSGEEFVFYEGPPTANGKPGIHHLEARAFKDAIPRYKTMRGFHVRRKGGWDTHGLPVELQVEKELGLKSKKEIEKYGVAQFNEKCRESVWEHVQEWSDFTNRIGYWIDLQNPYVTYKPQYIESVWNIIQKVNDKGLFYKDYKVVPWCPRCGTALSSHELAQGYEEVKDLAVTVKFRVLGKENTYFLAWTTTPWTLPGNVALAVGEKIEYVEVVLKESRETLILARERLSVLKDREYKEQKTYIGKELVGWQYEPLYPFTKDNLAEGEKPKLVNAFKVYPADFVTTADGTGIVHTAVMYGQDDFELGTKVDLPKHHLVNEDGTFKPEAGFLAGKFVKDEATDVAIIKDLAGRGLLLDKEKYQHSYPFCWRCHTPLIYFARDSWYIKMSALRDSLVKENEKINWEPNYIKEGRFGEWLREVKDWAISRERYWGAPLPVWKCHKCHKTKVIGSIKEIEGTPSGTEFFLVRHGESQNNVEDTLNSDRKKTFHLTEKGKEQAHQAGKELAGKKIDLIFSSPFPRTRQTAEIIAESIGYSKEKIVYDERLVEMGLGDLEGIAGGEYGKLFKTREEYFSQTVRGIETRNEVKARVASLLIELDAQYPGRHIVIISHESPLWMMTVTAEGLDTTGALSLKSRGVSFIKNGEIRKIQWKKIPRNGYFELDLHRPYIDEVKLSCDCGGEMTRAKEVMDVWFDSGAMPFAQDHYPFENKERIDSGLFREATGYPADYICEAIDQTRGWFYTLHAIGVLTGKGHAFNNVICLGHILDAQGKKMSKSLGNAVDPWAAIVKYGADPLRFWMYSINQPGESKNFDERSVDEVVKKVFNLASNVLAFYQLYAGVDPRPGVPNAALGEPHVLDRWILSRLNQLIVEVTEDLENYKLLEPTRAIRDFIADLSQWYLRRSRERFKGDDKKDADVALATTRFVLLDLAKLMAPFTPFFAEYLYKNVGGEKESVHMEEWPRFGETNDKILEDMAEVRKVVSLALEARAKANIKVRQPLSKLSIKSTLSEEFLSLISDEVNVKEVVIDSKIENSVELETAITPELKKEGAFRELTRQIQELRKEKGLKPGELVVLRAGDKIFISGHIEEFKEEIKKAASLSDIEHSDSAEDFELK